MRRIIYFFTFIAATVAGSFSANGEQNKIEDVPTPTTSPFQYPQAPDSLNSLEARTSYVMLHFWDNADMKKVMADTAKFHKAFSDFIGFTPYAATDSARKAISALTSRYANDTKSLLLIASEAERTLFGPEAEIWSDDYYIHFIRPVLANKKIKASVKQKYLDQILMLNASQIGASVPTFDYTTRHGARHSFYDINAEYTFLMFQPADCSDCSMTRLRLNADAATTNLVKNGTIKIVIINPGESTDKWRSEMESYPYDWEIGSAPEVGKVIDVRESPTTYLLDSNRRIVAKHININQLLGVTATINQNQTLTQHEKEAAEAAEQSAGNAQSSEQ
jgi:hypothetical protein